MTSPGKAEAVETPSAGRHPFKKRLHAWWHGYHLPKNVETKAPESESVSEEPEEVAEETPEDETPRGPLVETAGIQKNWPHDRREIAEMVWGQGFIGPGGPNRVVELARPLGLDPASSLLEIGSGMGGSGRAIAEKFGAYVTGWDLEPELVAEATTQAMVHGQDKKVVINKFDPNFLDLKKNHFSAAIVREIMFLIADKHRLMTNIVRWVRVSSQIVIEDLFFDDATKDEVMVDWAGKEAAPVYPWGVDEATSMLEDLGIEIRISEDESQEYSAAVLKGWGDFIDMMEKQKKMLAPELSLAMVREVEFWSRRVAALDSGKLRLYRIMGIKKKSV